MTEDVFRQLAGYWGFETSARLNEILRMLMTADEARLLLALPATATDLGHGRSVETSVMTESLNDLFMRGLVFISDVSAEGREVKHAS